ncbi:hypothetical protein ABPG72_012211 [Tetrahymena utriculariae]
MDVRKSFPFVRQNQHVMPKNLQCQRGVKRSKDQAYQFVNLIQQVTQILSKERPFRTKEEVSLVAIVIKQSNFFKFYEKELEKSPSAIKQIVESMSYESYIPGQEIYTEKDRAKKVYIVLSGDVCILSQKIKKDRFKNISEIKNIQDQNKSGISEQLKASQQMKLKQFCDSKLLLDKSFSHNFNQFKQLESISQYDFFGDTDVRYLSKNSFSAIAKTRVECAVIPQEVFNVYLGETSEIAQQVKEMLKCSLFKFLDPQYVEYCLKYSKEINFPKQKIIFKEGENSSEVYYIKQGDIELSATLPKQSDQEIKVEDIETNIAAQADNNDNETDTFDPEKFIKSNLFNQTLYEKGGPVSKNRQFWNQGDTKGQDYITKLKEQLDFKCKQFQQRGIQYTQIKVEDQVKKFMIASLSNKFQDKDKANFLSQAINRNVDCGLKLALLSKGGYFGEEIIFQHPLMVLENTSPTISPKVKENKKQKSQNFFFVDEQKNNQNQHENENNKNGNKQFHGQQNELKNNQIQQQHELEDSFVRQYTVKCQSASCILLKIEMELYLSLIYLNQKQSLAKKYVESQIKQERRQLKLKNHLKLILKPNKVFTQQNETDQPPSSIKTGKSIQFFTGSSSNQQLASEDPSTPNSKKLELSQKNNMSHSFNNQFYVKKQDAIDSGSSIFPSTDKHQLNSQMKHFQVNEIRQKNNSECLNAPSQLNNYQFNKIKQRNSIDKINLNQSQELQNLESTSTNMQGNKSFKNNNSLQYYRQSHYNNHSQSDFSDMFSLYIKQESQIQKANLADQNLRQQKQVINQSKTAQKQSQMREEIDNLYYTFSSILQNEENRQRQISLMTNSLEKICNNNYYNRNFQKDNQQQGLSITLPNQNLSEQNVQKEFQFYSPIQSAQKGMERVFFSSHYSQLSQVINYSNNDSKTADQIKKNISINNQTQNAKLSFKKQALNQSRDFGSQSEQKNPIIQKQKVLTNSEIIKFQNDIMKNSTNEEREQNNKQLEIQFNESRESFKSKLISSSTNENEQNPKSICFQSKEQIQNNQKDDFNIDQEKVFVFDQQNSPINNQISFLQNSFISIQEDDKDQQLLQTNNAQQENTSQKKFLIRDKNVFIYPKKYVLQPLFSEIIENEVERLQQSEQKKQNERIKIEINQDFYIKRYRKAYKEAFDLIKRPEKKQVNSIFDDLENSSEKQNKKQIQENLSLIIQKKFQIDKRFPNSKRAQEINDFFSNHIKKLDEQHKSKLHKFKREKDINAIITKQLVHKLEQQNIKRRNDLNYAGTNFNFILKDTDKKNSIISKNNNNSHESQNQKQVK